MIAETGTALLRVISEAQRTGCTGCCTAEYARDRRAVRAAVKSGDLPTLRRVALSYGYAAATVTT